MTEYLRKTKSNQNKEWMVKGTMEHIKVFVSHLSNRIEKIFAF